MHVPRWRQPLQPMAAERPETGQDRGFTAVEQRRLELLFTGGFSTVEQHDSGQQPLPGATGAASA